MGHSISDRQGNAAAQKINATPYGKAQAQFAEFANLHFVLAIVGHRFEFNFKFKVARNTSNSANDFVIRHQDVRARSTSGARHHIGENGAAGGIVKVSFEHIRI